MRQIKIPLIKPDKFLSSSYFPPSNITIHEIFLGDNEGNDAISKLLKIRNRHHTMSGSRYTDISINYMNIKSIIDYLVFNNLLTIDNIADTLDITSVSVMGVDVYPIDDSGVHLTIRQALTKSHFGE